MTSIIEKAITFLAPNTCVGCGYNNNILCSGCLYDAAYIESPLCCLCGTPSAQWQPCAVCRPSSELRYLWACCNYDGMAALLIKKLKFNRAREAAQALAGLLNNQLPYLNDYTVCPVPTAPGRVRQRGYDQAVLLAKAFAPQRGLPYAATLGRLADNRQVGATRQTRQRQAQGMFYVRPQAKVAGRKILLIDDVLTTGATLSAAAGVLYAAGAAEVSGAAVARKD